jgi:hypothetical protein
LHRERDEPTYDGVDHRIRARPDLFFGQWHNRVWNSDDFIRWNPQVRTLEAGRLDELGGGDIGGGNPLSFKVGDIVRTARYARPSRAKGFNDRIAL